MTFKEWMEGVKVVSSSWLISIAKDEVEEPGTAKAKQGHKPALLVLLVHPLWVKNLILVYVSSVLVMVVVGHLPWVIWNLWVACLKGRMQVFSPR